MSGSASTTLGSVVTCLSWSVNGPPSGRLYRLATAMRYVTPAFAIHVRSQPPSVTSVRPPTLAPVYTATKLLDPHADTLVPPVPGAVQRYQTVRPSP